MSVKAMAPVVFHCLVQVSSRQGIVSFDRPDRCGRTISSKNYLVQVLSRPSIISYRYSVVQISSRTSIISSNYHLIQVLSRPRIISSRYYLVQVSSLPGIISLKFHYMACGSPLCLSQLVTCRPNTNSRMF